MIEEFLQLRLDQALATCRQRWLLGVAAVLVAVLGTALAMVGNASGQGVATMLVITTCAAILAVSASGTHLGAIVVGIVAFQWAAFAADPTGARVVVAALCLYAFHALTALMAAVPHTTEIDPRLLRRWAIRSLYVAGATVAVWGLVVAFERNAPNGNEAVTVLGLAVIAAVLVIVRRTYSTWWSAPAAREPGRRPSGRDDTTG